MRWTRPTLWLFGALLAMAPAASSAESDPDVTVEGCGTVDAGQVHAMVALELRVLGSNASVRWPLVRVTCAGELARIQVGATTPERTLDLTGFPVQARARVLAVEISVLLAPLLEQPAIATPAPAPVPPAPVVAPTTAPTTTPPRLELGATTARLGRPQAFAYGLDLGLSWPLHDSRYLLHGDLRALTASWSTAPGEVRARDLSVGLAALLGSSWGNLWYGGGPMLRGGYVWLRGLDARGFGHSATWWGPAGSIIATWTVSARWTVSAKLEVGYVALPVEGTLEPPSIPIVSVEGMWASAALTVGLAL